MFALMRFEIRKFLARKRNLAGFGVILLMNALFCAGFTLRNRRMGDRQVEEAGGRLVAEFLNAPVFTQSILAPCMFMLFPMILAVIGCHILAGEIEQGNMRLVASRPVSRTAIVAAKFGVLGLYSAALLACLLTVSYAVSALLFKPTGDVLLIGPMFMLPRGLIYLPESQAWGRLFLSYLFAWPMCLSVTAMALMFSLLTRHFTSAAILTTGVYFCSYIVSGIELLSAIHPFMPTRYLPFWRHVLQAEIPWQTLGVHAMWTGVYTALFLAVGAALFNLRDL